MCLVSIRWEVVTPAPTLQCSGNFLDPVSLQDIPDFDIIKAGEFDSALQTARYLFHVFLMPSQGIQSVVADRSAISINSDAAAAFDTSTRDMTTGDGAGTTNLKRLFHQCMSQFNLG